MFCAFLGKYLNLVFIEWRYCFMAIPGERLAPGTFPGFHSLEPVVQWTNSNTQTIAIRDFIVQLSDQFSVGMNWWGKGRGQN
jgi:hypothetical protein